MTEYAFDGLVGPTHQYAGLSLGNLASSSHAGESGNPRAAALQGLAKMQVVASLCGAQAVLPPHERPYLPLLRRLGFSGTDADVLESAYRHDPGLLSATSSASAMWAANAATVTSSRDTPDARTHFTPANLVSMLHRSLESETTTRVLRRIFSDPQSFVVHDPIPALSALADEGAANHTLLCTEHGRIHLFGWGRAPDPALPIPTRFPARQTRAASEAVARRHGLPPARQLLWQQDPAGIDAGAFHTDVLAVGSGSLFLMHEHAFCEPERLAETLRHLLGDQLSIVLVREEELALREAVAAYPFNSQLLQRSDGQIDLVAPSEAEACDATRAFFERVLSADNPLASVTYVDVNDSMRNGGGPACLRLRVPLSQSERAGITANVFWSSELAAALEAWVNRHHRDRLSPADLRDPKLLEESYLALDELTQLLRLGTVYEFQGA